MRPWHPIPSLVFGFLLLAVVPSTSREVRDDVSDAAKQWADVFALNDADKILALYSEDGVLWGTLSPTIRADRAALRAYFVAAFKALPNAKVLRGATRPHLRERSRQLWVLYVLVHQGR